VAALAACGVEHGTGTSPSTSQPTSKLSISVQVENLAGLADQGDQALRDAFNEVLTTLGADTAVWGDVGITVSYQYLAELVGVGPDQFHIGAVARTRYESIVRVAHELNIPLVVTLDGSTWGSATGPFVAYWKIRGGGMYLSRYQDWVVNADIGITSEFIPADTLRPYVTSGPGPDRLTLTSSYFATDLRAARLAMLGLAMSFWQMLDAKYPGTIAAFTTDPEVSNWSFRKHPDGTAIPIGYEDLLAVPYCRQYAIVDCARYFDGKTFDYDHDPTDRRWYEFRAGVNKQFTVDTVGVVRASFPSRPVYTHQVLTAEGEYLSPGVRQDWASPPRNGFIPTTEPGFDVYINDNNTVRVRQMLAAVGEMGAYAPWGLTELNTCKNCSLSVAGVRAYTREFMSYLHSIGVTFADVRPWLSDANNYGIRDSGAALGIRDYLHGGP
jgi:hypothetical protein